MEVDLPIRAAVDIKESAGGRSKGGSGAIINENIMQVFIFTAFLTIILSMFISVLALVEVMPWQVRIHLLV